MTPLMGGSCREHCSMAAWKEAGSETSPEHTLTCAPCATSSSTVAFASGLVSPDRDTKAMCRAPDAINSRARLRPRPPRPPMKRYVALGSSLSDSLALHSTGALALSSSLNDRTILPRCLPCCMMRKASSTLPTGNTVTGCGTWSIPLCKSLKTSLRASPSAAGSSSTSVVTSK